MADLVSLAEMKNYLGDAPQDADDAVLTALLDDVEALFESATLRPPGFFTAGTARTEVRDGTGSTRLFLTYPVAAGGLTSVKLGYNSASPDETLVVSNKAVIVYGEGSRQLTRTDGGYFGHVGQPRYVEVVYTHQGALPEDARLAIKSVCATAYRRRGSEAEKSETLGSFYSHTMIDDIAAVDPFWQIAVEANMAMVVA